MYRNMVQKKDIGIWCALVSGAVPRVTAAGVIADAPSFTEVLMNILTFALSLVGIVAILALGMAGGMYLLAAGDASRVETAKKYVIASVFGIVIALAALIIVRQVTVLL